MKSFLQKKDVVISFRRYAIETMGMMTLGIFASLIMGLILREIGSRVGIDFMVEVGSFAHGATGFAMGVAVAYGLKAPPLVLFASAAVGFAGNYLGGPMGAMIAAIIGAEFGKIVSKETKVDIIVTPAVTLIIGVGVAMLIGTPISWLMSTIGGFIMWSTELMPALMGGIVAIVMGMLLTSPLSSAAISITLGLEGIAAGAAVAGCAANMIGFAVSGYRENKVNGLVSQGIGTSMLQLPNIMKNPLIWVPPIVASAVGGVISATVFAMETNRYGAGMGTSGLVGQFNTLTVMGFTPVVFLQIGLVHFLLPAIVSLAVSEYMRKKGWIKFGDMKLAA
ncbi:MAG: PTS sugar transporter subunit IIC [Firmicutes bacterium]|nr:PTS sugar transporter subunit IIC [Bacillota bacterium]